MIIISDSLHLRVDTDRKYALSIRAEVTRRNYEKNFHVIYRYQIAINSYLQIFSTPDNKIISNLRIILNRTRLYNIRIIGFIRIKKN